MLCTVVTPLFLIVLDRHNFYTSVQVYNIVNKISPPYLHDKFSFAVDVTDHSGRNVHRLFVLRVTNNYGKHAVVDLLGHSHLE